MRESEKSLHAGTRIRVRGLVQGVGFRPAVWRMAHQFKLSGQVLNIGDEVMIDIWGTGQQRDEFALALIEQCPPLARIDSLLKTPLTGTVAEQFQITKSQNHQSRSYVTPDAASCPDCINEIFDSENNRFRYPFTNCTNCGPRLSIIDSIPYDRVNTSMKDFLQCHSCKVEYEQPQNRRFHAQPNACPACGPKAWLEPNAIHIHADDDIERAKILLTEGKIIAIKGIGGFHLACDANNKHAVDELRKRKNRPAKPFALMAKNISTIEQYCLISRKEKDLLESSEAPVVLLKMLSKAQLPNNLAPLQRYLGFMLPYTPLHHLLMADLETPLVMTSGNVSGAPQAIDNNIALGSLKHIADYTLLHDRDIRHRIDDSVVRVVKTDKVKILRRARGYAPAPICLPAGFDHSIETIAFGSELKNTFCLIKHQQMILSQHMGDLENAETFIDYEKNLTLYQQLFQLKPKLAVVDKHPEYLSSKYGRQFAQQQDITLTEVQHHHAHHAACLADNNWPLTAGKVLGIILDGSGFGEDETIWGGEFIYADYHDYERLGSFKPIPLIGASKAIIEPWRNTYAHLHESIGIETLNNEFSDLTIVDFFRSKPCDTLNAMLTQNINSPLSSSCGRLFDAVAAAIGICREQITYEGQAAITLESIIDEACLNLEVDNAYPFIITSNSDEAIPLLDASAMWECLLNDLKNNQTSDVISSRFHHGLANAVIAMVERIYTSVTEIKTRKIVLSGGVFQNKILFQLVHEGLEKNNFEVLCHQQVPTNDGGLALGQAVIALARNLQEKQTCA